MRYFLWWFPNKIESILYLMFQYPKDSKSHAQQKEAIKNALIEYKVELSSDLGGMTEDLDTSDEYDRGYKDAVMEVIRIVNWKG